MAEIGVVFSNLGTPQAPNPKEVGDYLAEFLMDHHVIQWPWFFRLLLVRGIIVPFRKARSAAVYREIWSKGGSPLLLETEKAAKALQARLGTGYKVVVAMRYGEPSFARAKKELEKCSKIIFFPQYPQYAASTFQTGVEHFCKVFGKENVEVIPPYYDHPAFIQAYEFYLKEYFKDITYDHILMSFHGLPESHLKKSDPSDKHCLSSPNCCETAPALVRKTCYKAQCYQTAKLLAQGLELEDGTYSVSFQSRLGRQKWIEPYTDQTIIQLAEKGIQRLAILCPGFSVDGLETLEEIAITGKKEFLSKGGKSFQFIPCLNDNKHWIEACAQLVKQR